MSVWNKLFSAVKGGVNEAAESVADTQALRILDQEIRDAENALRRARSDLAGIMASNKSLQRRVAEARDKERKDTESARAALQAGREDLARGLADRISKTRTEASRDEAEPMAAARSCSEKRIVAESAVSSSSMVRCSASAKLRNERSVRSEPR